MNKIKLRYIFTIPFKTLFYGSLSDHHATKAKRFKGFSYLVMYHRDLSLYYFQKAFGHLPVEKEETK